MDEEDEEKMPTSSTNYNIDGKGITTGKITGPVSNHMGAGDLFINNGPGQLNPTKVTITIDSLVQHITQQQKQAAAIEETTSPSTNNIDFDMLQKSLKKMYLKRFRTANPFSLPFTYNIENTWVSLALKGNTNVTEDHAELLKEAFTNEMMLIVEGKPATGKTTLMRRLAYEWASGKPQLMHYDLIMYAEFRELRNQKFTHIAELVASYLQSYVDKETSMELQKLVTNEKWFEEKHVLVLLDGYDESSSKEQCVELYSYFTNEIIDTSPSFKIVMTTRPGHLPAELKEQEGRFVFAEVLGFITDEQKMKYISNHFSKHEKGNKAITVEAESVYHLLKSQEIQELATVDQRETYILNHFSKGNAMDAIKINALSVYFMLKSNGSLRELAETPLFLAFICLVHKHIIVTETPLLDLYYNIVRWLLDRHQKICKDNADVPHLFGYDLSQSYELKQRRIREDYLHFPQLQNLGNMGLHNLKRNSFSQSDLDNFKVRPIIEQVGLLRKEEKFDAYYNKTTEFFFMHRTFQEFLAALSYLYWNGFSTQVTTEMIWNDVKNFMESDIFHRKEISSYYDNQVMTEYEKFLWRILTSNKLPISPEIESNFFASYLTLVLDLNLFSLSAEIAFQQSITYLEKCSNITELRLVFRRGSFLENSQLNCSNLPVLEYMNIVGCSFQGYVLLSCSNLPMLKQIVFKDCSFQGNLQLSGTNLPTLEDMWFYSCSFQENSQLNCANLPMLKRMHFESCSVKENSQLNCSNLPVLEIMSFVQGSFQKNSQLHVTNLPVLERMEFWNISLQENSQLNCANLPVLEYMRFVNCSFQENTQLNYTNLTVQITMSFEKCSFQENSQINCTNLPVFKEIYFWECSFQGIEDRQTKTVTKLQRNPNENITRFHEIIKLND